MTPPSPAFLSWARLVFVTVLVCLVIVLLADQHAARVKAEETTEEVRNRSSRRVDGLLAENKRLHEEIQRLTRSQP